MPGGSKGWCSSSCSLACHRGPRGHPFGTGGWLDTLRGKETDAASLSHEASEAEHNIKLYCRVFMPRPTDRL